MPWPLCRVSPDTFNSPLEPRKLKNLWLENLKRTIVKMMSLESSCEKKRKAKAKCVTTMTSTPHTGQELDQIIIAITQ